MPLSVSFTAAQNIQSPASITLVDTSTGTDVAVTFRKVYITTANNTYLTEAGESTTPTYTTWDEPDATITIDVLSSDMAVNITVEWCNSSGTALYTSYNLFCFTLYSNQFYYTLTQLQSTGNLNVNDTVYYTNKEKLKIFIDSANNAVEYASDITGAQQCLNAAAYMIDNQNLFF